VGVVEEKKRNFGSCTKRRRKNLENDIETNKQYGVFLSLSLFLVLWFFVSLSLSFLSGRVRNGDTFANPFAFFQTRSQHEFSQIFSRHAPLGIRQIISFLDCHFACSLTCERKKKQKKKDKIINQKAK
jgi:hypothetical protein